MGVQPGNGDGHDAGTMLGQRGQVRNVAADAVALEDQLVMPLAQPVGELHDQFAVRRIANGLAVVSGNHGRAFGLGEAEHHLGRLAKALHHAVAVGHGRQQVDDLLTQLQLALRQGLGFPGLDLQGKDAAEQLAGGTGLVADLPWLGIVAGDQPPQAVADDDGNGHRRQRAHVAHVLQVHRRDAAQGGKTQVQWRAGNRVQGRHQGRRLVVGVLDHPDRRQRVQGARLGRDVAGR